MTFLGKRECKKNLKKFLSKIMYHYFFITEQKRGLHLINGRTQCACMYYYQNLSKYNLLSVLCTSDIPVLFLLGKT